MSSILVVDKENDIFIYNKNNIENLFMKKKNKLENFNFIKNNLNKNIIPNSYISNEKNTNFKIYNTPVNYEINANKDNTKNINNKKKHEKYLDDMSSMPKYTFDKDIKLGYDDNIINNGKFNTLRISSLPISEFKKNSDIDNNSIYISDAEILEKINESISLEKQKDEEKILKNIKYSKYDLSDDFNFLNKYELSPILLDVLSFGNLDYSEQTPWKVSRIFDKSIKNFSTSGALNYSFKYLSKTKSLNPNFIHDLKDFDLTINGIKLKPDFNKTNLEKFKELIPDLNLQQLISTYVNRAILTQPYLNLLRKNPELINFKPTKSILTCEIEKINEDSFKILITDITILNLGNDVVVQKMYKSCGVRTAMIISKVQEPKLQHLYYIN